MSQLWADTPDYYATAQIPLEYALGGTDTAKAVVVTSGGRRASTNALRLDDTVGSVTITKTLNPSDATIAISFGLIFERQATAAATRTFFAIGDGTVWHLGLAQLSGDGTLAWYMGRGLLAGSGGTLIENISFAPVIDTFYSVSIKATINNATGALSFKINGVEQLNGGAGYTNIDTQNAGTAAWTRFAWGNDNAGSSKPPRIRWCDIVVNDGAGSVNNNHPGDCAVLADVCEDGNGSNADFTPNSGTDHGDRVNEIPEDADTTYNQSSASGQRDSYIFANLSATDGTVRSVINRMCLKLSEAGASTAVGVVYKNATNYDSAVSLSPSDASYAYFDDIRELDPQTSSAWTIAQVNASEFGVKRAT